MNKLKIIQSFSISTIISFVFIVISTIVAELHKPFKNFLVEIFYHHWVGKGVIALAIFLIVGFILYFWPQRFNENKTAMILLWLFIFTIVGFLVILGFYIYEGL